MRVPVILDVDTGVDDACALLFAARHPGLDLRAVTCVGGNASLADVTRNSLTVLDIADRADVPVAAGAARPLLEDPVDARHVHGADGMGDLGLSPSRRRPEARHAVELLRDELLAAGADGRPITLIPLAPMTNIALLLRTYPAVAEGIERIVFMGGAAASGNATASAEFNVFHDPEAAAIVLDACADLGIDLVMYGLDVFYEPTITLDEARALQSHPGNGVADLAGRLIEFGSRRFESDATTIGDAGAVCAVADPEGIGTVPLPIRVELTGRYTRGRTIVDHRDWTGDLAHDPHGQSDVVAEVALAIDGPRYARLWMDTMRSGPTP